MQMIHITYLNIHAKKVGVCIMCIILYILNEYIYNTHTTKTFILNAINDHESFPSTNILL